MTLICPGGPGETQEAVTVENCGHWVEVVSTGESSIDEVWETFPVDVHTYATGFSWSRGTITKGVSDHG